MPQITFTGMKLEEICDLSLELKDKIQEAAGCERRHIKFDYIDLISIDNGTIIKSIPKIEMLWLPKSQTIQDNVAKIITALVQKYGYSDVQVSFNVVPGERYYENGEHY